MVAIIIVNYNGSVDTLTCIESLLKSSYTDYRIIVVDNASTPDSLNILRMGLEKYGSFESKNGKIIYFNGFVTLILSSRNCGFAGGNNIGVKYAVDTLKQLKYIWLLNNDTTVKPNTLYCLVNYMNNADVQLGILGNKLLFLDDPTKIQAIGGVYNKWFARCKHIGAYETDRGQYDNPIPVMDYVVGASMFVRKTFIEEVGYMSEDYFLYFEELDWILRGKACGWNIGYIPEAIVFHKEGGSTKEKGIMISEFADICQLKNRILFTKRFYPLCLISVLPMCAFTILLRLINGRISRSKVLFKEYIRVILNLFLNK